MLLAAPTPGVEEEYTFETGHKQYELSNHLGNVLATISDRKIAVPVSGASTIDYYVVDYTSFRDYYPFGMEMPGRSYTGSSGYRFGFNGQEKDDEISGKSGGHLAFKYRIHDARLGRFLSVDPLEDEYPWNSTYAFAENRVIEGRELEGLEMVSATGNMNFNFQFDFRQSGLSAGQQNQFMNDFIVDINSTWGGNTVNGNPISLGSDISYFSMNSGNVPSNSYPVISVVVQSGSGVDNANRQTMTINTFVQSWIPSQNNFGYTAGHEFGHLFGLSDRYLDMRYRNILTQNDRVPQVSRVTMPLYTLYSPRNRDIDLEYVYLDNLYSSSQWSIGAPSVTSYQIGILFSDRVEPDRTRGITGVTIISGTTFNTINCGASVNNLRNILFADINYPFLGFISAPSGFSQYNSNNWIHLMKDGQLFRTSINGQKIRPPHKNNSSINRTFNASSRNNQWAQ